MLAPFVPCGFLIGVILLKPLELEGKRFGKLTVIERRGSDKNGQSLWLVKCDCGTEKIVMGHALKGGTSSCGCSRRYNTGLYKHGLSHTRIHYVWRGIIDRCCNPRNKSFSYYGGRGISICEEWKQDFVKFYDWAMENGYDESLTIDRIDTDKDYCPENCRWVDMTVQSNNRRNNHTLEFNGEVHTVAEWGRILGMSEKNISNRLRYGFPIEDVLNPNFKRKYKFKNEENERIKQLCIERNVSYKLVMQRVNGGWSLEDALSKPRRVRPSRNTVEPI